MLMQLLRYIHSQWVGTQCECKRTVYVGKGKQKENGRYHMYCIRPKHHFGKHMMDHHAVQFDTEKGTDNVKTKH